MPIVGVLLFVLVVAEATAALPIDGGQRYSVAGDATSPLSPMWSPTSTHRASIGSGSPTRRQQRPTSTPSTRVEPAKREPKQQGAAHPSPPRLVQVSLLHRHGARTPPQVHGTVLSWQLCHLSDTGAAMAENLGRWVRTWYGSFIGDVYDPSKFVSHSDEVERTIRTAYGVVSGAFNRTDGSGNAWSVPLIHHIPFAEDAPLGFYYSWAAALLHKPVLEAYNLDTAKQTLSYLSPAELQLLGNLTGASAVCDDPRTATTCALFVEDVGTCLRSNGGLTPEFRQLLTPEKLLRAASESFRFLYGTHDGEPYYTGIGPYGMQWLTKVLDQFDGALVDLAKPGTPADAVADVPFHHYSAHDNTVIGALVALGVVTINTTDIKQRVPMFTSAVRLELYSDGSVTLHYSTCDQDHGSEYSYTDDPNAQLHCQRTDGTTYTASSCPLADLRRVVERKLNVSKTEYPPCFALPTDVARSRCAPWDSTSKATLQSTSLTAAEREDITDCMSYRSMCPAEACDPEHVSTPQPPSGAAGRSYVLNRAHGSCHRSFDLHTTKMAPVGAVYALFACAMLSATILTGFAMYNCGHRQEAPILHESSALLQHNPNDEEDDQDSAHFGVVRSTKEA